MAESKSDAVMEGRNVHLVSQEGESFDVALETAKMSELVKTMIDEEQEAEEAQEIPLPNVKSQILTKVIDFIAHYKTEAMTEIEKVRSFIFYCFTLQRACAGVYNYLYSLLLFIV